MSAVDINAVKTRSESLFLRKRLFAFGVPALVLVYFIYIFFAFDVPGLMQRASLENARTLTSDTWSHKVHVTRDNRSGEMRYAYEGERKGEYPEGERPDWVSGTDIITVDLGGDTIVRFLSENRTEIEIPGFDLI